jgi:hypothetical protein
MFVALAMAGAPAWAAVGFLGDEFTVQESDPVAMPITVTNFTDVDSFQFTLEWQPGVLSFSSVTITNTLADLSYSAGSGSDSFGDADVANGKLTVVWFSSAQDLGDNANLFTVNFTTVGAAGTSSTVAFVDDPVLREVSVNSVAVGFAQLDGNVSVVPEPMNMALGLFAAAVGGTGVWRWRFARRIASRSN